jgi:hypothetical protein
MASVFVCVCSLEDFRFNCEYGDGCYSIVGICLCFEGYLAISALALDGAGLYRKIYCFDIVVLITACVSSCMKLCLECPSHLLCCCCHVNLFVY